MLRRTFAIAISLPAILAAQDGAARSFRFYGEADYGKCTMSEKPELGLGDLDVDQVFDDLESGTNLSFTAGALNTQGTFGFGVLYQASNYDAKLKDETSTDLGGVELEITDMQTSEERTLLAALALFRHSLSEKLVWTSALGLGNMTKRVEIKDMEGVAYSGTTIMDYSADAFIEGSGFAFVLGTGLDYYFTPSFGIGARFQYVNSTVSAENSNVTMDMGSTHVDQEIEDVEDDDASQTTFSGGARFLF